jgi:transcriptional regulator
MYQPPAFREDRIEVQHELIRRHPLGCLVTHGPEGLVANHIPFLLDPSAGPLGTLAAHLARANAQWREAGDRQGLVIFQGPESYVTPSWYETKRETGKVVPTWNYAVVHVWGRIRVHDDPAWLRAQVERLTGAHEGGRADPWAVEDAPAPFVAAQLKGIVGIEIAVERLEGKWKVSQNRPESDRRGVADGLGRAPDADAPAMAALVSRYGGLG